MKKQLLFAILITVTILGATMSRSVLADTGFSIGPASLELTVPADGNVTAYIYITSSVNGSLVVGTENLTFAVEPSTIPITPTDNTRKVEIVVHGNSSLAEGQYSGKLTFLLYAGNNVAHGIKLSTTITQEGPENEPNNFFTDLLDALKQNYILILAVVGMVVALILGVFMGKRTMKRHHDT